MTGRDGVSGTDARMAPLPEDERGPRQGFHARAMADPAFQARFEAAYTGEDDPLDALWWLDHPDQTAPSGAVAPAALARTARGALYGPGTDPAALERYEQANAAAERSRAAAVAALGRLPVRADRPPPPAGPAEPVPSVAPALRPRATRLVLVAGVALAAVALAAGFGLGRATSSPVPVSTPALDEHFQQTVKEQRATAIFERAPEPGDLLGGDLEPLDTVNLRRLVTIGSTRFFGARTTGTAAAICLIAVQGVVRTAGRCVSLTRFDEAGVTLVPADGLPTGFARVRWQPDGRLIWWSPVG